MGETRNFHIGDVLSVTTGCMVSPRGPDGWTQEEIIALEGKRLEALTRPLAFTIPS
jgi:hypothetical protein